MDYKAFYAEVADWINECNQVAVRHGLHSESFWNWVASSLASISSKYGNSPLVKMQMAMLHDWLYSIYEAQK